MEEFKGTQGKWKYKIHNSRIVFSKPNMDLWFKDEESDNDFKEKPSEVLANAKLIVAAPDLLEALQNLTFLHSCEQEGIGNSQPKPSQWFEAVDKAETAIAKALGKNF